jgi:hypothetical protein
MRKALKSGGKGVFQPNFQTLVQAFPGLIGAGAAAGAYLQSVSQLTHTTDAVLRGLLDLLVRDAVADADIHILDSVMGIVTMIGKLS